MGKAARTLREQPSEKPVPKVETTDSKSQLAMTPVQDHDTSAESSPPECGMCCFRLKDVCYSAYDARLP